MTTNERPAATLREKAQQRDRELAEEVWKRMDDKELEEARRKTGERVRAAHEALPYVNLSTRLTPELLDDFKRRALEATSLASRWTRICWWLSRRLGGRKVFGKWDLT